MPNQKISQLTAATTPLAGTEVFPIVQSGTTVKATIANVQAAPVAVGTANGVQYLNGSKVPTTGTDLVFNGNNLGVGVSSPNARIDTSGSINVINDSGLNGTWSGLSTRYIPGNNSAYLQSVALSGGTVTGGKEISFDASAVLFRTISGGSFTDRMRLDTAGNLGLVTPSAWGSGQRAIQMPAGAIWNFNALNMTITQNVFSDGTEKYVNTGFASAYNQNSGEHIWSSAPSGTGGTAVTRTTTMLLSIGGNLTINGATATKASGTTWANPSDIRLKDNVRDYEKGTSELMQIRVRTWEYNGKGGTTNGYKGLGVIADEAMLILPDTVQNYKAKLNSSDEHFTEIKQFDATEITWLLVKTVQEQQAVILDLKARLDAANF